MKPTIEELLGIVPMNGTPKRNSSKVSFSFLFFSDVRKDVSNAEKYRFMRDVTLFADREGFEAIYMPERHFYEFGSIYANPAIIAAYLIPQTKQIRFRSAGVSLPLHHPTEVVEWWAMNDILSGGRVDLGFGSGWNKADFITAPSNFEKRREICSERIEIVRRLWRGESISFPGPDGEAFSVTVHPRPIQKELNVWLLVAQNDGAFIHAGKSGYNVFTMLYGINLEAMGKKIAKYRRAREEAGFDPAEGKVTLMLHTLVDKDINRVRAAVEKPFKEYIKSALDAHTKAGIVQGETEITEDEKNRMLEYSYERYSKTGALFGSVEDARKIVDQAIEMGVDEIACLVDFGVDYSNVMDSLPFLKRLVSLYR
ncbi:MAG: luciferase-like monooxygenase family protein [Verrucomicrobiales bacterium]|nr:luciferase-like monooxygenase family protein [Verrucomicrobiales bacterium]